MNATNPMLDQKTSELETAVEEVERELSRADTSRRTETHKRLAGAVREAHDWLDRRRGGSAAGDDGTALAAEAESLLHEIRMHRREL